LEGSYLTFVEHGVDGLVHGGGVSDVHVLALAVGGAFSLESPYEADWLVLVFGNGCVLAVHHGLDGGVTRFSEASEHVSVSVRVEDRNGATLLTGRRGVTGAGTWGAGRCTRSRVVYNGVPRERERTEDVVSVGTDSADEGGEGRSSRQCGQLVTERGLFSPLEVGLLGVIENTVAEIHADGVGASTGVDSMHAWSKLEDSFLNVLGNGGLVSMEYVDKVGPSIEFLGSLLRSGWVANIAGSEGIGVGHGGGVSSFSQFGLTNSFEDLLVIGMSFAADGER
jgi:hypothetical protein